MPTRLRKIRKQRGTRFHGWGQVGQHRSTGMKGGSGKAGLLKHKWTWTVKYDPEHFGAKGFTPPNQKITKQWINIGQLGDFAVSQANGKDKLPIIDLDKMGYDKLLGQGQVKRSLKIIVPEFSGNAKTKIEKAGGSIESR